MSPRPHLCPVPAHSPPPIHIPTPTASSPHSLANSPGKAFLPVLDNIHSPLHMHPCFLLKQYFYFLGISLPVYLPTELCSLKGSDTQLVNSTTRTQSQFGLTSNSVLMLSDHTTLQHRLHQYFQLKPMKTVYFHK